MRSHSALFSRRTHPSPKLCPTSPRPSAAPTSVVRTSGPDSMFRRASRPRNVATAGTVSSPSSFPHPPCRPRARNASPPHGSIDARHGARTLLRSPAHPPALLSRRIQPELLPVARISNLSLEMVSIGHFISISTAIIHTYFR